MTIKYIAFDGLHFPMLHCDWCEQPIHGSEGNAYFTFVDDETVSDRVWFGHKTPRCLNLERVISYDYGHSIMAEDLAVFLKHVKTNFEVPEGESPFDRLCEVDGCLKRIHARGLCQMHYMRDYRRQVSP